MSDDRTPMQRALDAEALVADLAKRVAELEATLKPFSDFAGELFARNNMAQDPVAMLTPDDPHGKYHKVTAGDFFAARKAISAPTPSVGGSLAEENERLRKALRAVKQRTRETHENYDRIGPTWTGKDGHEYADMSHVLDLSDEYEAIADAALSGKDRT